jgi:ABC-type branched-subunit amino acid transport system permease subunit
MGWVWTIVVLALVLAVLAVIALALFEMSPFGRHADHLRDPATGKRRWESPNLEDGHY